MFEGRGVWETVLMVDVYGCYEDSYGEALYALLSRRVNVLYSTQYRFQPYGITCVSVLSESHLAVHTYPEIGVVTVILSTCARDGEDLIKMVIEDLLREGYTFSYKVLQRGRKGIKCIWSGDARHGEETA